MIQYPNISSSDTGKGYLHLTLTGNYTKTSCRQLLEELNDVCLEHGYEAIMINLGKLNGLTSVSDIWRELNTPEEIPVLPYRIAWVNGGEIWNLNWKRMATLIRHQSLNWQNFSELESAENWLTMDRRAALAM